MVSVRVGVTARFSIMVTVRVYVVNIANGLLLRLVLHRKNKRCRYYYVNLTFI